MRKYPIAGFEGHKNYKFVGGWADGKEFILPEGVKFMFLTWETFDLSVPEERRVFTETYELIAGRYYWASDHANNINNPKRPT